MHTLLAYLLAVKIIFIIPVFYTVTYNIIKGKLMDMNGIMHVSTKLIWKSNSGLACSSPITSGHRSLGLAELRVRRAALHLGAVSV